VAVPVYIRCALRLAVTWFNRKCTCLPVVEIFIYDSIAVWLGQLQTVAIIQVCCLLTVFVSGLAGPRFDASNDIIPHSILGDVEDFVSEAVRRGDLSEVKY